MKILTKIVIRITEHFTNIVTRILLPKIFAKIVTNYCEPIISLPKTRTKIVAKIQEWKILS